jgi:uridylate kinase
MADRKRILLKLSGELFREADDILAPGPMRAYATAIHQLYQAGLQVAVVLGGGNILRGRNWADHPHRADVDHVGMLATVLNAALFKLALEDVGCPARVFSARPCQPVAELFERRPAIAALDRREVILLAGGTGNPFFSTDSAAALRAAELDCDCLYKGTLVDGVYDSDPHRNPDARRFDTISFDEVLRRDLRVVDGAAVAICRDAGMPVVVFDSTDPAKLSGIADGSLRCTVVGPTDPD